MQVLLCAVSAGYVAGPAALVRAPSFDSAIIKSDRLGGNFAYSTAESYTYAAISPRGSECCDQPRGLVVRVSGY